MKNVSSILTFAGVILLIHACKPVATLPVEDGFLWLTGEWLMEDQLSGETWSYVPVEDRMDGRSWKIQGNDTVYLETMQIIHRRDKLFFMAEPSGSGPVYFEIVDSGSDYFVSENPFNDFPSRIEYRRTGNELNARISSEGREQTFSFIKK